MLLRPREFAARLLGWYDRSRRDLPWRVGPGGEGLPSAYHVLVSELMLQQTQVSTVIPYFHRFIARFPTLAALAGADEQEVLRHWQGLGYYARARNLLAAARQVLREYDGQLPQDVEQLQNLSGVGRYTAGAVSSIAFDRRAPILDGNVTRVICRLDNIAADPRDRATQSTLWRRAEELLPSRRVGDFNSALMELGALVCVPRWPQCLICPVSRHCEARAAGVADRIPAPRKTQQTPLLLRKTFCIRRGDHWLIEQRPAKGRWSSLWQFITREADQADALPVAIGDPRPIGSVSHALTHRRYRFEVFTCDAAGTLKAETNSFRRWTKLNRLGDYPLPRPHLKIAEMLRVLEDSATGLTEAPRRTPTPSLPPVAAGRPRR